MNRIVERSFKDAKDPQPVNSPLAQEENLQGLFLDPDLSNLESGVRLRGAILECSGREISGWIVDSRSPAASVALSLFVGSHAIEETRTGRAAPAGIGARKAIGRPGFHVDLTSPGARRRLARALRNTLADGAQPQIYLRVSLDDGEYFEIPLFDNIAPDEVVVALGFSSTDYSDLLIPHNNGIAAPPADPAGKQVRYVCFYLPQFHSFAENDRWWGPGFSEWTNVSRMRPQFPAHQSPWLPADLGFYDVRLTETRRQQADLARRYGIHGFCYYVYWFQGRRLLETPLKLLLKDGEPNLPFCICWANENWSRRWDGSDAELLLGQNHSLEDDVRFIDDMAELLLDERYIAVDGRKIILIYRPSLLPDKRRLFEVWRVRAKELGIGEILICNAMTFGEFDPRDVSCDAAVEFPPHTVSTMELPLSDLEAPAGFTGKVYDYVDAVRSSLGRTYDFPYFPAVMPRWDNTPRKGPRGHVFNRSSPEAFEVWLRDATRRARKSAFAEPIVFINSWNEWAEGAHLEPDSRYGRAFLEAARRVASSEPISIQVRSNPELLDCLSRQELEQAMKEAATHVELLASLHRSEMVYSGLQHARIGMPAEMQGASESPAGSLFVIENINSQTGERVVVDPRSGILVRGWVCPGGGFEASRHRMAFLILLSSNPEKQNQNGYCLIVDWHERLDVKEYMRAESKECYFGFQVSFLARDLPDGEYRLAVLEVGEGSCAFIMSSHSIIVRR
ncbi:MAG TPA: glycoside hydrolase family 99-like domain-containing protein [Bradyrhizobium sp.]|nr:glycoside hydrolase family 99-like domain-containing protein [Bradyrhizobium sp.]